MSWHFRSPSDPRRWGLVLLIAAVALWGILHSLGAYLATSDLRRTAVMVGTTVAFVGFWLLLLSRKPPNKR